MHKTVKERAEDLQAQLDDRLKNTEAEEECHRAFFMKVCEHLTFIDEDDQKEFGDLIDVVEKISDKLRRHEDPEIQMLGHALYSIFFFLEDRYESDNLRGQLGYDPIFRKYFAEFCKEHEATNYDEN